MSHKGNTETFYREIMGKVIEKMKEDFNNEGISEDILVQLKKIWEDKLILHGIFQPKPIPQMSYPKLNLYQKTNLLKTDLKKPGNSSFKSSGNTTTNDNVKHYLEDKKNVNQMLLQQQQLQAQMQVLQPRFYTSTPENSFQRVEPPLQMNVVEPKPEQKEVEEVMKEEVKEGEKSEVDSDVDVFIKKGDDGNAKEKMNNQNEEGDELLSPLSSDSNDLESDVKDFLLAQYEKVHRVRNKWKIHLKDAILHINGKEFVFDRVVGELDRDW